MRLVKGANLAMEHVEAELHGWIAAPYGSKAEVDASYKALVESALRSDWAAALRDRSSPATTCSTSPGRCAWPRSSTPTTRIDFEMLEGMAPPQARQVHDAAGGLLLYAPVVADGDFDGLPRLPDPPPRREHRSPRTSCARCSRWSPDSPLFDREAARFRAAVEQRHSVSDHAAVARQPTRRALRPRRRAFANEPDSDVTDPAVRAAFAAAMARPPRPPVERITDVAEIDAVVERAAASFARGEHSTPYEAAAGCSTRPR